MDTFFNDLLINLQGYYDDFITLLPKLVMAIIVFSILFFLANNGKRVVNQRLSNQMDDPLLAKFLGRIVKVGVIVFAFMVVSKILGLGDIAAGIFTGASFCSTVTFCDLFLSYWCNFQSSTLNPSEPVLPLS